MRIGVVFPIAVVIASQASAAPPPGSSGQLPQFMNRAHVPVVQSKPLIHAKKAAKKASAKMAKMPLLEQPPADHAKIAGRALLIREPAILDHTTIAGISNFPTVLRRALALGGASGDANAVAWLRNGGLANDLGPLTGHMDAANWLPKVWSATKPGLDGAPFRLLAIVNRPDLAKFRAGANAPEDNTVRGAELRFTYGAVGATQNQQAHLIIEFVLKDMPKANFKTYLNSWLTIGQTDDTATRIGLLKNLLPPVLANGVQFARVRFIGKSTATVWPMREFKIGASGIVMAPMVRQLPSQENCLDGKTSPQLAAWLNAPSNKDKVLGDQFDFSPSPAPGSKCPSEGTFPSSEIPALRAAAFGSSPFQLGPNVTSVQGNTRALVTKLLDLNSCTRCHSASTATNFVHVEFRAAGAQSTLSGFLCGAANCTGDVSTGYFPTRLGDMNDLLRRHVYLRKVLSLNPQANDWTTELAGLITYEAH